MNKVVDIKKLKRRPRNGFCRFPLGLAHSRMNGEAVVGEIAKAAGDTLSAFGCKLLIVLLDNAQRAEPGNDPVFDPDADRAEVILHRIRCEELLLAIGSLHDSTDRLNAVMSELSSVSMEFDICDEDGAVAWDFVGSIIQFGRRHDGWIVYWFNPALWPVLRKPRVYSRVFIEAARALKSQYAIRLYQATAAYAGRRDNVFKINRDQLEDLLCVPRSYRLNFSLLRKHVLDHAIKEINSKTEIQLFVGAERTGRGGTVSDFEFEVKQKAKVAVVDASEMSIAKNQAKAVASADVGSREWIKSAVDMLLGTGVAQ